MKRIPLGLIILLIAILASGCQSPSSSNPIQASSSPLPDLIETPPQPEPTATVTSTRTAPTPTKIAEVALPPQPEAIISSQNVAQIEELMRIGNGSVGQVAFSPDGNYLAVATTTGVQILDATTLVLVREYPSQSYLLSLAFSPDGDKLAANSLIDAVFHVWDFPSGMEIYTSRGDSGKGRGVAFSPDGKIIASGGADALILWDTVTREEIFSISAAPDCEIITLAFSPDGDIIAYAIASTVQGVPDDRIILWDITIKDEVSNLIGHKNRITDLSFSPDGTTLASSATDKTMKLWDISSGQEITTLTEESNIYRLAFSPDGTTLAYSIYGSAVVKLWDTVTQETKRVLPWSTGDITFSPDGQALASSTRNSIELWDLSTDELQSAVFTESDLSAVSPDGKTVAAGGWSDPIRLWDITTGDELYRLEHPGNIIGVAFSPDGTTLASGGNDEIVRIWEAATGALLQTFSVHTNYVRSVAFSPDGAWLASGGYDARVRLWNVATGQEERLFMSSPSIVAHDNPAPIESVAFSPDAQLLAAGLTDNRIIVWDVATGDELLTLGNAELNVQVDSVAFSPDGKILASGSSGPYQYPPQGPIGVRLWDVATGQQLEVDGMSSLGTTSLAFSLEGNLLAAGITDGTINLIDIATWEKLTDLQSHASAVMSLTFSADGKLLISSSTDQTTRIWGIAPLQVETGPLPFQIAPPQLIAPKQVDKSAYPICDTVSEIPVTECNALVALYHSTGGENWVHQDGWLETNTPCSWYGITCEAYHVTAIKLNNNQLTGELPPEIGNLARLNTLDAMSNNLDSLPAEIGNLTELFQIHLEQNNLRSLPSEIGNLNKLGILDLSNNELSSLPPEIGNLIGLWNLDVMFNNLNDLPAEIGDLPRLYTLYLTGNNLESLPTEFSNLTTLQELNIENNNLSSLTPELCSAFAEIVTPQEMCTSPASLDPACGSVLAPRLVVGKGAIVDDQSNTPNRLREEPGINARHVSYALPGAELDVLDGPVCADGMWWWQVLVIETQIVGWTVEGDTQEYWLIPEE